MRKIACLILALAAGCAGMTRPTADAPSAGAEPANARPEKRPAPPAPGQPASAQPAPHPAGAPVAVAAPADAAPHLDLKGLDAEALHADRAVLGQVLETFVVQELRRLASGHPEPIDLLHYRDRDGGEVDVVLEQGPRAVAGVEVKAGATVTAADFRGLRKLQEAAGARFKAGVVLCDGEATLPFGERFHAVPLRRLWEA